MLRILGLVFLSIIAMVAIAVGFSIRQDRHAREYVVTAIPAIYKDWNFGEIKSRAAAQLRDDPQFNSAGPPMFEMLRNTFGPLQKADEPQGSAGYGWGDGAPARGTYGDYVAHATFAKAEAELELFVVKENGEWRIAGFHVNSPALVQTTSAEEGQR